MAKCLGKFAKRRIYILSFLTSEISVRKWRESIKITFLRFEDNELRLG